MLDTPRRERGGTFTGVMHSSISPPRGARSGRLSAIFQAYKFVICHFCALIYLRNIAIVRACSLDRSRTGDCPGKGGAGDGGDEARIQYIWNFPVRWLG